MSDRQHIAPAILEHLRSGKRATSRDLEQYSERKVSYERSRHVDQTLQRLRRKGLIKYDTKRGWLLVEAKS